MSELRYIHPEKRRYYTVRLQLDLFGAITLVRCWGSLDSSRGGTSVEQCEEGAQQLLSALAAVHRRRLAHDYLLVT